MCSRDKLRFIFIVPLSFLYLIVGLIMYSAIIKIKADWISLDEVINIIINLVIGTMVLVLLIYCKKHITQLNLKSLFYGLFVYGLPFMIFYACNIITSISWIYIEAPYHIEIQFEKMILRSVIYYLSVVFCEELVFRAGFINYLLPQKNYKTKNKMFYACIVSSLSFGAVHFVSILTEPEKSFDVILRIVILGVLIGYIFAVIYIKTKNIISVMILHFLWDITVFLNNIMINHKHYVTGESYNFWIYQIIIILLMFCYINLIFYKSKAEELMFLEKKRRINCELRNDIF